MIVSEKRIPTNKWERSVTGGKTAVKVGGAVFKYYVEKPFLRESERKQKKSDLDRENAEILFQGLALLKGTALKIAQLLSFELELIPPALRKELEKSYNQVPPINRALVRKRIRESLGGYPEDIFQDFNTIPFAAASLGQVHGAKTKKGKSVAVKIQYPGMKQCVKNDIRLAKGFLKPLPDYTSLISPALAEIEARLIEETDYLKESAHTVFFSDRLKMDRVCIPDVFPSLTNGTILTTSLIEGLPLNIWLKSQRKQVERDTVAQTLHNIFLKGFYEFNCIHADPNPGNFIVRENLTLGLVDFGCVKRFTPQFVENYRQVPEIALSGSRADYFNLLKKFNMHGNALNGGADEAFLNITHQFGKWLCRLYKEKYFDFGNNPEFMVEGKHLSNEMFKFRRYFKFNPHFVYLNRTRYGLLRLFEKMRARVCIRNPYEWVG